jgi:hypothetical protein
MSDHSYKYWLRDVFPKLFHHPRHIVCLHDRTHKYENVPKDAIPVINGSMERDRMDFVVVRLDNGHTFYLGYKRPVFPGGTAEFYDFSISEGGGPFKNWIRLLEDNDPLILSVMDFVQAWLKEYSEPEKEKPSNYLGETPVDVKDSPYKDWNSTRLAMYYIESYGQIDGAHHKTWVLDQVAKALKGGQITDLRKAEWTDHPPEWRFSVSETPEYLAWVEEMKGEDGDEYDYDHGIAP